MVRFLRLAALAVGCARLSALPADMEAFVATSPTERSVRQAPTPALGDLRRRLTGLPSSCEVLVAVNSSSVNPADRSTPGPFPQVMGSDLAGVVVAVEDACQRLRVGDRVWADIGAVVKPRADGGGKGKENGAYGQVAAALETQLGVMPTNLGFDEAGALPKVALTSYKALQWYGGAPWAPSAETSVLILGGSGGTGTAGIQLAKAFGAKRIITTTSAHNEDYVRSLGASDVIDYHTSNWWEVLANSSIDVIYDTVGQKGTGQRAMAKLKSGGFYVTIVGALPSDPRPDVKSTMFINSDTNLNNFEILEELRVLVEADKLRMRMVKSYPLAKILDAFAESEGGHTLGKLVIHMPQLPNDAQLWA